jgi:hypothetical protein
MQTYEMAGLSVILTVLLIGTVVIVLRWFRHRERLAMIQQGLIPDAAGASAAGVGTRKRRGLLLGGLSIAVLGLLLLCAAFFVAFPQVTAFPTPGALSSVGWIPLPGLLVAFMGVGLLILYVWAQPTVERQANATAAPVVEDAEIEGLEPELEPTEPALEPVEPWGAPASPRAEDAPASTLDVKAPPEAAL